jgi:hypothetical protein
MLPKTPVAGNPIGGVLKRLGDQLATAHAAVFFLDEQPGPFQYAQVSRDRGQRDIKRFRQLHHRRLATG